MNQATSFAAFANQPPGTFGPVTFSASMNNGKPCRRARMYCRDFDPKALREGRRDIATRLIERKGATDFDANLEMEKFKAELDERFPNGRLIGTKPTCSVQQCIDGYMKHLGPNEKIGKPCLIDPHTFEEYGYVAKAVVALLGGGIILDQLTSDYIGERILEPGRKRSKERIGLLKRAINHARLTGVWQSTYNPCDVFKGQFGKKAKRLHKIAKIVRAVIAPEKITRLMEQVIDCPQWLAFYFIAAFAGPRCSELLDMRIDAYDAKEGTLAVIESKTEAGDRVIVLGHTGRALVERLIKWHESRGYTGSYLFPAPLGGRATHTNFQKTVFKKHMLAAGLAEKIGPGKARNDADRDRLHDGIVTEFTMHEFRHTASTRDKDIVPEFFLSAQLGHKTDPHHPDAQVTLGYAHPQDASLFPKRREYAELVDARVKALLPKRERHLQAAS